MYAFELFDTINKLIDLEKKQMPCKKKKRKKKK